MIKTITGNYTLDVDTSWRLGQLQEILDESGTTSLTIATDGASMSLQVVSDTKWLAVESTSAGPSPYKVYTALLTQTGTNAPVATVLENTLGGTPVWTRVAPGEYIGTLSNSFTSNKTFSFIAPNNGSLSSFQLYTGSTDQIDLTTFDSTSTLSDDLLDGTSIEIRVYN